MPQAQSHSMSLRSAQPETISRRSLRPMEKKSLLKRVAHRLGFRRTTGGGVQPWTSSAELGFDSVPPPGGEPTQAFTDNLERLGVKHFE